jgi:hypothetical protein
MPFCMLFGRDIEVSLIGLHDFLTLQISTSGLTLAPPVCGYNGDVMEIHGSIVLPIALGAANDFQTFLANFFIVDLMLPYEATLTWEESQAVMAPLSPC